MKADNLKPKQLFQKDVRYVVPTFQRPYVWNQEEQWEPLWDDVRNTAERYLDELAERRDDPDALTLAESAARPHFLGAVVLQQHSTPTIAIEERHVIDGQQRLLTLQLLLDAAQEVFERQGLAQHAKRLSKFVLNDVDYTGDRHDAAFKVWPANVDQEAFRHAMSNGLPVDQHADSLIVQGHKFFQLQIEQWLEAGSPDLAERADALETTLLGLLELVVIDLEARDDPHVIFETLNARGTPLIASDLIKNYALHSAVESGIDPESVYAEYWRGFDDPYWRTEIRQGRIVRPRLDVFLNYWLIARTAQEVAAGEVFRAFRGYVEQSTLDIRQVISDLKSIAETYRGMDANKPGSVEDTFMYRWQVMDAGVVTPLLLWLFSTSAHQLPRPRLQRALRAIESFLVRRMACRMTTKDYNRLLLELLVHLQSADITAADDAVIAFLAQQTADARIWPSDSQFVSALQALPLYWLLTRRRLRMILEGIEEGLRTPKAEHGTVPRGQLTIEHIMPQAWHEHWPIDAESIEVAEQIKAERERIIHTIGNLTLVNKKLNPALSNSSWPKKRTALQDHSVLFLNKTLLNTSYTEWNEAEIQRRGNHLGRVAVQVWPSADRI